MSPALALIGALLSPLPASMPPEATACVEALAAPAPKATTDRHLPGACAHTGPAPNRFAYRTASGMALAGEAKPDGELVTLGDGALPVSRKHFKGGKLFAVRRLTYSGTRLTHEAIRSGWGACLDQTEVTHHYEMFGRPDHVTRERRPCKGKKSVTMTALAWQPDGTALVNGGQTRRAKGVIGDDWFSAECAGKTCTCERRTYDAHNNLLRSRRRTPDGDVVETTYDYSCWPPKAPTTGPKAGDADRGKPLYTQFCATCHGSKGHGDGPGATAEMKVRNLASMGDAMCGQTNAILHSIKHGVGAMPAFPMITEAQARDVVAYIRRLQGAK